MPSSASTPSLRLLRHFGVLGCVVAAILAGTVLVATAQDTNYSETPQLTDGVDGEVFALKVIGDEVWVGGDFDFAREPQFGSPEIARSNLAVFNLNTGDLMPRRLDTNGTVYAIESDGQTVWLGGEFTSVDGTPQNRIAAFDLFSETFIPDFASVPNGLIRDIHLHEGWLYVGGNFQGFNSTGKRNAVRIDPFTGTVFAGFSPNPNATVRTVDAIGDEIVLAGTFTRIGPDYARENELYVAGVHRDTGVELSTDYEDVPGFFERQEADVAVVSNDGQFVYVGDENNMVIKYRRSNGQIMWSNRGQGNIQAFAERGDTLYVGLHDGWLEDGDGFMLVALDTSDGDLRSSFAPEMNSFWGVRALEATDQGLIAVGDFTNVNALNARRVAMFRPAGGFQPEPPLMVPTPTPDPAIPPTPTPTPTPAPTPTPGPTATPEPTPTPPPPTPTPTPAPIVPIIQSAEVRTDRAVLLEWEQTDESTTYEIAFRLAGGSAWQVIQTVEAEVDGAPMSRVLRSQGAWNPQANAAYELALRGRTGNSVGAYSAPIRVRFDVSDINVRQGVKLSNSVTVNWDAADSGDDFGRYDVYIARPYQSIEGCLATSVSNRTTTSVNLGQMPPACGGGSLTAATHYVVGVRVVQSNSTPAAMSEINVASVATSGGSPIAPERYEVEQVNGDWEIVNSGGSPVQWNAMNIRRGELNSYSYTLGELQDLKARGFDTVRIVMEWSRFEREPGEFHLSSFLRLDQMIERAEQAGLDVILDPLHLADGPTWQIPDWAWTRTNDGVYADDQVLTTIRDNAVPYLQHVTHRYQESPVIAAIDVINEPREPAGGQLAARNLVLMELYHDLIEAIRDVDPDVPLMLEPYYGSARITSAALSSVDAPTVGDPSPRASDFDNLIWSLHDYYGGREGSGADDGYGTLGYALRGTASDATRMRTEAWTETSCYPAGSSIDDCTLDVSRLDVTIPSMRAHVVDHLDAAQGADMPLFIGEFGIPHPGLDKQGWGGGEEFIADKLAIYESLGIGWAWWIWRVDVDPTFGLYDRGLNAWHPWTDEIGDAAGADASVLCAADGAVVEVMFANTGSASASYSSTVSGSTKSTSVAAGSVSGVTHDVSDGQATVSVARNGVSVLFETIQVNCGGGVDVSGPLEVMHVTSCLAGNGRFDTNIVNTGDAAAEYRIEFEGLSARARTVQAGDWWRMPITGRPDRDFNVVIKRAGVVVSDTTITVSCDTDPPQVDNQEIRVVNSCRAGNGYLLFQFVNPTAASKGYVIQYEGVPNRSTSAAAFGQSVRAVTGRPDGIQQAIIKSGGATIATMDITVECDA